MSNESLSSIGDTIFDIVFGFFNSMVSVLTGGVITNFLGGYTDLASIMPDLGTWLSGEITTGFGNVLDLTERIWASNITTANSGLMDILDLSATIERAFQQQIDEATDTSGALVSALDRQYNSDRETGAALTDFALRMMVSKASDLEGFASDYYDRYMTEMYGDTARLSATGWEGFALLQSYLARDLQAVEALSDAEATSAAAAILEVAKQDAAFVEEWFLETVVKPISYGENIQWAIRTSGTYEAEEIMGQIRAYMIAFNELQTEMVKDKTIVPNPTQPPL
jgi:hypothetical protein